MSVSQLYTFPEQRTLIAAETERSRQIDAGSVGSQLLPINVQNWNEIYWDIKDNVRGLTPRLGADEPFPVTSKPGATRFTAPMSRFGEEGRLTADELTRLSALGSFDEAMAFSAMLNDGMQDLAIREFATVEFIRWRLLANGEVFVQDAQGVLEPVASVSGFATNNLVAAQVPWATVATATPINDFRLLRDNRNGFGFDFGRGGVAYASSVTWNALLRNTNANDFGGMRGFGLRPVNGLAAYNEIIAPQENLPTLVAVDDTFINANGAPERLIPDNRIVVVGRHWANGLAIGDYIIGRHEGLGGPGIYAETGLRNHVSPPVPFYARGHRGGPRLTYQRQVAVLNIA